MNKTLNILAIVMVLVVSFCCLWETFMYKRKLFNERNNYPLIRTVEHSKGDITYLIFISPEGEIHAVNYTQDSMDFDMHRKFNN